jgi:hypothetical protein
MSLCFHGQGINNPKFKNIFEPGTDNSKNKEKAICDWAFYYLSYLHHNTTGL